MLGVYVMNLGYGFEGSFQPLGRYTFGSRILAADANISDSGSRTGGNRFATTWLGAIPVPLPRNYVTGMDLQRIDFERKLTSYLNGEWKEGGWWYYYLEAAALNVPLGTWLISLVAAGLTLWNRNGRDTWRDELVLLAPAIAVMVPVSSNTAFSRYLRYVLPAFPFVFIWCSKTGRSLAIDAESELQSLVHSRDKVTGHETRDVATASAPAKRQRAVACVVVIGLTWSVLSSLWIHPHSMSYFNEFAGGPHGGHHYLLDGNIDWGQDVFYLKRWYDAHPKARPIEMSIRFSPVELNRFDLGTDTSGPHYRSGRKTQTDTAWYAVSVHALFAEDSRH